MRTTLCKIRLLNDKDDNARQGLNTEAKVVGREQDSGETVKERGREAERCWKWEMVWAINSIIRENIYGKYGRIIWNNQDAR
jgi:hypothetical protein